MSLSTYEGRHKSSPVVRHAHFLEVLRLNPRDVDALINVSNLQEAEGDFTASVTIMQKAVGLATEKPPIQVP